MLKNKNNWMITIILFISILFISGCTESNVVTDPINNVNISVYNGNVTFLSVNTTINVSNNLTFRSIATPMLFNGLITLITSGGDVNISMYQVNSTQGGFLTAIDYNKFNANINSSYAISTYYSINNPQGYLNKSTNDGLYYSINNPNQFINSSYGNSTYYSINNPDGFLNKSTNDGLYYSISNPSQFINSSYGNSTYYSISNPSGFVNDSFANNTYAMLHYSNTFDGANNVFMYNVTIGQIATVNISEKLYNSSGVQTVEINGSGNSYILNNLGIGTTNPLAQFEINNSRLDSISPAMIITVNNSNNTFGALMLVSKTAVSPTLTLSRDGSITGTGAVRFYSPGGTTTSLSIRQGSATNDAQRWFTSSFSNTSAGDIALLGKISVNNGVLINSPINGGGFSYNMTNYDLVVNPTNNILYVLKSGNVGIGSATPNNKLEVIGNTNLSGIVYVNYSQGIYSTFSTNATTQVMYVGTGSAGATLGTSNVNIFAPSLNGAQVGSATGGFFVNNVAPKRASIIVNNTVAIFINENQSVGIGTSTPTAKLEVAGSGFFTGANNPTTGAGFKVEYASGFSNLYSYDYGATLYKNMSLYGVNINLMPQGVGNVGIGTTTPTAKLDVNGSINISGTNSRVYMPNLYGAGKVICYNATDGSLFKNTSTCV